MHPVGGTLDPASDGTDSAVAKHVRALLVEQVPVLRAVASRLCRGRADAVEDLVQDVFEKALRSLHTLDLKQSPRGWMIAILHNLHVDRCRRYARLRPHVEYDEFAVSAPEPAAAPDWAGLTADDVRRAAAELPPDLREAYSLFAFEGRTYAEVAAVLGIPITTVGTRILRARARLKEILIARLSAETP